MKKLRHFVVEFVRTSSLLSTSESGKGVLSHVSHFEGTADGIAVFFHPWLGWDGIDFGFHPCVPTKAT
jgi:hypothetical protein